MRWSKCRAICLIKGVENKLGSKEYKKKKFLKKIGVKKAGEKNQVAGSRFFFFFFFFPFTEFVFFF